MRLAEVILAGDGVSGPSPAAGDGEKANQASPESGYPRGRPAPGCIRRAGVRPPHRQKYPQGRPRRGRNSRVRHVYRHPGRGGHQRTGRKPDGGNRFSVRLLSEEQTETWSEQIAAQQQEGRYRNWLCYATGNLTALLALEDETPRGVGRGGEGLAAGKGIRVVMLTGDQQRTALAVARKIGHNRCGSRRKPDRKIGYCGEISAVWRCGHGWRRNQRRCRTHPCRPGYCHVRRL